MASSGMLRHVALVRTDVSEELSTSFVRVTRIGELGTMRAVTSNRRSVQVNNQMFLRNILLPSSPLVMGQHVPQATLQNIPENTNLQS
jgi:hypothetical protein